MARLKVLLLSIIAVVVLAGTVATPAEAQVVVRVGPHRRYHRPYHPYHRHPYYRHGHRYYR